MGKCISCGDELISNNNRKCGRCLWGLIRFAYKRPEGLTSKTYALSSQTYMLEKMDPKHRRGKDIIAKWHTWKHAETNLPFFEWLDQEEEHPNATKAPVLTYNTGENEKRQLLVSYDIRSNMLTDRNEIIDSNNFRGKFPSYGAYTMTGSKLYFSEHRRTITHASLQGGTFVHAAGMMRVNNGKIVAIMNCSGHYKPGLESLYHTVSNLPVNSFDIRCQIHFKVCRFAEFAKKHKDSSSRFSRWMGAKTGRYYKTITLSVMEFKKYAEVELSDKMKLINKYDKRGNHLLSAIWESYLAKSIIEGTSWLETLNKINAKIMIILKSVESRDIELSIFRDLKAYFSSNNFDVSQVRTYQDLIGFLNDLFTSFESFESSVIFHKRFCEHVMPLIYKVSETRYFEDIVKSYQELRKPEIYRGSNRGCNGNSAFRRKLKDYKKGTEYRGIGIIPKKNAPENLQGYYDNQSTGEYYPAAPKYAPNIKKYNRALARKEYKWEDGKYINEHDQQYESYQSELQIRDITFGTGASGTTAKIIACFLFHKIIEEDLDGLDEYFMLLAAVLCARGHHSMYEVLVVKRTLHGDTYAYNPTIIREKLLTAAFKDTPGYTEAFDSLCEYVNDKGTKTSYDGYYEYLKSSQNFILKEINKSTVSIPPAKITLLLTELTRAIAGSVSGKIGVRSTADTKKNEIMNVLNRYSELNLSDHGVLAILKAIAIIVLRRRAIGFSSMTSSGEYFKEALNTTQYFYFAALIKKELNIDFKNKIRYRDLVNLSRCS